MTETVIAHEHYIGSGGAERVADELASIFDAPIVTGYNPENKSLHDPINLFESSPLKAIQPYFSNSLLRQLVYLFAWETAPALRDYETVIQSGNAPMWYVPDQDQTIVKYNHSPPRKAFDLFGTVDTAESWTEVFNPANAMQRLYLKALRQLWQNRIDAVDLWVCNSEIVKHRTKKYLGVSEDKLTVVYPPVDVREYEPTQSHNGTYVALSRLDSTKRITVIIEAWDEIDAPLTIVGTGPQQNELEAQASGNDNIQFTGRVSEERKRDLLQNAKATVFAARNEDFGIVPVESMAAGTPVIGVNEGFTQYQILHGKNGLVFDAAPEQLRERVSEFERDGVKWNASHMHRFSQQFGRERFAREMQRAVKTATEQQTITAKITESMLVA